jgi:hypothetical protein
LTPLEKGEKLFKKERRGQGETRGRKEEVKGQG